MAFCDEATSVPVPTTSQHSVKATSTNKTQSNVAINHSQLSDSYNSPYFTRGPNK